MPIVLPDIFVAGLVIAIPKEIRVAINGGHLGGSLRPLVTTTPYEKRQIKLLKKLEKWRMNF